MSNTQAVEPSLLPHLQQQVSDILAQAKKQGATACEVSVSVSEGLSTSVRQGDVETVEFNRDQGFGITVYAGKRKGSASTTTTGEKAIKETVAAALAIAKHTSEDEFSGLADAELMATELPDLDLWHPWAITPEQAIETALACEAAGLAVDSRIKQADATNLSSYASCSVYGNSHGFIGGHVGTQHSLSSVLIAEQQGEMQRDYWYDFNRRGELLDAPEVIGRKAAERTLARLGSRSIATCKVPVIFSAQLASGLLGSLLGAISGGNLYRKSSFLEGALGQQLFPEWFNLYEQPQLLGGLSSSAFDGDGLATFEKHIVQQGVLESYLLSTYSARKLGMHSTANSGGARNVFVSYGDQDLAGLLRQMDKGLLVTELMGQGLNMVTGDYSRGAAGFWVEHGEIQFPVHEVTIAGNLKQLFRDMVAIGNDLEKRANICTGSVLLEQMTVAGS